MNKAQKKIIGISIASCAVLSIFASTAWVIVESSNIVPRDTSLNKYSNLTSALAWNNGLFIPQKMSISDWINVNVPSKMLVEKTNNNSFILYLYTDPGTALSGKKPINQDKMLKIYKEQTDFSILKTLNSMPDSPLICKIFITENTQNLYSYKITLNDELNGKLIDNINDYTLIESTVQYENSKIKNIDVKNSIFKTENISFLDNSALVEDNYKLTYSSKVVGSNNTNETLYSTAIESLTSDGFVKTLEFTKKTSNENSSFDFSYTSFINNSQKTLTTKYTAVNSNTNPNYKLYNLSQSHNGTQIGKKNYQSEWLSITNNTLPSFHLPQELPFIEFYNNIDFFRTNNKK